MADDADSQAQARVGTVVDDKWTLERLLGVGGMAAVYAAKHRNGARAAVKVLHPDLSRHKEVRERFLREGYAANRVEHPGAVKVLDDDVVASGPEAGTAYIVMELLEGESLQERLERGPPLGELDFLAIAASVLEVLEAAHARGVVHRDLKPENLFLVRDERTARKRVRSGSRCSTSGSRGSSRVRPSRRTGSRSARRRSCLPSRRRGASTRSTGARISSRSRRLVFACVPGRRIHEAPNPVDLVLKMSHLAAPKVRSVRPDVSEPCARVIDRALEFRREDRYESATAMLEDVRRAVTEIEARGPTQLAIGAVPPPRLPVPPLPFAAPAPPVPPSASFDEHTTIQLGDEDLREPSRVPVPIDESIRLPKNRSVLPWIALLAFAALGVKLVWFGHRASSTPSEASALAPAPDPGPSSAGPGASARAPVILREGDAATEPPDAAPSVPAPSTLASGAPARPMSAPGSPGHHAPPGKVGPGNVHKLPRKHRATKAKGTQ